MSEWKIEVANALQPTQQSQAGTCETVLVDGLQDYGIQVARDSVQVLLDLGKRYLDCKFGEGTPQAQNAFGELSSIVSQCAISNLPLLFSGKWAEYTQAVFNCVIGKLLGGIGGGGSNPSGGYQPNEVKGRC